MDSSEGKKRKKTQASGWTGQSVEEIVVPLARSCCHKSAPFTPTLKLKKKNDDKTSGFYEKQLQ